MVMNKSLTLILIIAIVAILLVSGCTSTSQQISLQSLLDEWNGYQDVVNEDSENAAIFIEEYTDFSEEWESGIHDTEKLQRFILKSETMYEMFKSHLIDFRDFLIKNEDTLKQHDAGVYISHKLLIEDKLIWLEQVRDATKELERLIKELE